MALVSIILGGTLIGSIAVDLWLTVLHPTRRGPLSHRVERLTWLTVRALARATRRSHGPTLAGPSAMVATLSLWVGGLWLGYGLIYLPFVDSGLSYSPSVAFGAATALDALYVSGVSLTTIGFGDVVAATDALRMVTVAEAASGFAVISGAISYLISVYPQVSVIRSAAARLSDSGGGSPAGAARLVIHGGAEELGRLHDEVIAVHQNLRRFPILHYFHAGREEESMVALLRGAALVSMQLRWGIRAGAREYVDFYARGLPTSVERIMSELAGGFSGGRRGGDGAVSIPGRAELESRCAVLRAAVTSIAPDLATSGAVEEDLAAFESRADAFLQELADRHGFANSPLLDTPQETASRRERRTD